MTYITTLLMDGEAYAGPIFEAASWEDAKQQASAIPHCQVTGILDSACNQEPE